MSNKEDSFLNNAEVGSEKSKIDNNIHLEKGESITTGLGMDRFSVTRTSNEGRVVTDESSMKLAHMKHKQQKTAQKASKVHNKTQRTVYRMEKVYDRGKGIYTFKPVAHKVDKDFESRRKSSIGSKGKEFLKKTYQVTRKMIADELPKDDGYTEGVEKIAKGSINAFKKGSRILKNASLASNKMMSKHLQNKADWLQHSVNARSAFEKRFAQEVGKGNISKNAAKRALQKEIIKNKYKAEAVLKYTQQRSKAVTFFTSSKARKKMLEQVARTVSKSLLIGGAVVLLFGSLLGGCTIMFGSIFSGFGGIATTSSLGVYLAEPTELEQAEKYFTQLEMRLVEGLCNIRSEIYSTYDADESGVFYSEDGTEVHIIVSFNLRAVKHDPNTLLSYLTAKYDGFVFDEENLNGQIADEIRSLFAACYGVSVPLDNSFTFTDLSGIYNYWPGDVEPRLRDQDDPDTSYLYQEVNYNVGDNYTFRSLEDVVSERLADNPEGAGRYEILQETYGGMQRVNHFLESAWRDRVEFYFGHNYTYTDPTYDGWSPDLTSVPDGATRQESFSNRIGISCPSAENIHAGMAGKIYDVGTNYVIIEELDNPTNHVIYEGLSSVNVVKNQTVSAAQIVGTCDSTLYVSFTVNGEYRNPMLYLW